MKLLLQHRIHLGYIILIAVIGSMAAIMFHERNRVQNIESETNEIREANRTINTAHRYITVLATLRESAITWAEEVSGSIVANKQPFVDFATRL